MKTIISALTVCWFGILAVVAQQSSAFKIGILSDIHFMAPELLDKPGKAFDNYIIHDRKLLKESPELLDSAVHVLIQEHPEFVFISGDLTKDGEKISHRYVADHYLKQLKGNGCRVFVIPGNHDVNNPHAVIFEGDTVRRTETVTPDEFARIYKDYGYGQALARDPHSLSYTARLDSHTWLLAIDACKYEENDFDNNVCVTGGRIKPETMEFIRRQVEEARRQHCRIVTMMHHGIVEHWKWQGKVMKDYLIDDWKSHAREFGKLGLRVVFTGHFHAQDIAAFGKGNRCIYDVETGSTVSFPQPVRIVTCCYPELNIRTRCMERLSGVNTLNELSVRYARSGIQTIISDMLPASIPYDIRQQAGSTLSKAYVAHLRGDEKMPDAYKSELKKSCRSLRRYSWKYAFALKVLGKSFFHDRTPADNDIVLKLNK